MLARLRKDADDKGFTLIELLVVMIIIGILAAIAIPAFLSQKNKAKETSAKADAGTIGKEIAAFYVDPSTAALSVSSSADTGLWTLTSTPAGTTITGKISSGNTASGGAVNADNWCVLVTPTGDGVSAWHFDDDSGLGRGACPAAG